MKQENKETRLTRIYVLKDPRDNRVRYVGKTVNSLSTRLSGHISDSYKEHRYVCYWIQYLIKLDLKPIIEEIDQCSWIDSGSRERFFIQHYKDLGCRLTNLTEGGEGAIRAHTIEENKNHSITMRAQFGRKVYQYSITEYKLVNTFSSASEVQEVLGYGNSSITGCLLGRKLSHDGFIWSPELLTEEEHQKRLGHFNNYRTHSFVPLVQYSLTGEVVKEWESMCIACLHFTNKLKCNITKALSGKQATFRNSIWKYKNKVTPEPKRRPKARKQIIDLTS